MERRAHAPVISHLPAGPHRSVHASHPQHNLSAIALIAFLGGLSVFVYEILWIRLLALLFGTTAFALAIVIAAFLVGMGLGSLYFGHRADRTHHPVRLFVACAAGTFLGAMIVLALTRAAGRTYSFIHQVLSTEGNPRGMIVALSFALLIIPTFFMGALLPLLSRMYIAQPAQIGKGIGRLYTLHTVGGIAGALATTYVLIPLVGHWITYASAMVVTAGMGVMVLASPARFRYENTPAQKTPRRPLPRNAYQPALLLVIAGITGFCALAFEILWARILRTYVTNSTYSITNILIIYLAGVGLGSFIYYRTLHRRAHPWLLVICLSAIGYYSLAALTVLNRLPDLLFWLRDLLSVPILRVALPGLVLSAVLFFIPAILMGITFPLICHLYTGGVGRLGRGIGNIVCVNTCGGVAGSILATFFFIPSTGIVRSTAIIALIACGSALIAIGLPRAQKKRLRNGAAYWMAFVGAVVLFVLVFHHTMILPPSIARTALRFEQVLFYDETYDGTVIVTEDARTGIRACYINNNAVCGTTYDALKVVKMLGHLPCFLNATARRACIIGFGIGITASSIAQHDLTSIDCVEICPGVARAAPLFISFNRGIMTDRRVRFIPEDGRIHLLTTEEHYDIISCDPTHPTLGCNNLYTKEYFELCKSRLTQGGIVCQYLPLHKLTLDEFKTALRTFITVFPHVTIWLAHAHAVMIGTNPAQHLEFDTVIEVLQKTNDEIIHDPYDLICSLILDEHAARSFVGEGPLNTDNHPRLEFFSPAGTARENWDRNLYELLAWRIDPARIIHGVPDPDKLARYLAAQRYFLSALIFKNRGQLNEMLKAMEMAHSINPASMEIQFFLEHERSQLQTLQR